MNGDIVQAGSAQGSHVRRCHLGWMGGQFLGIGAERAIGGVQPRRPPIARDRVYKGIGLRFAFESLDLGPEVMRVGLNSVDAAVGDADDHRQHLALLP